MNKSLTTKVVVDIVMTILFILELNLKITGLDLHEVIGLFAGVTLIIHLLLNSKWIKGIINNKEKNQKLKLSILTNIVLLISFFIMIVTGIVISKFIFHFDVSNYFIFSTIHKYSAYICGIIILAHLVMHFSYLKNIMIKILKKEEITIGKKVLLRTSTMLLGILILYVIVINVFNKEQVHKNTNQYYKEDYIKKEDSEIVEETDEEDNDKNTVEDGAIDKTEEQNIIEPKPTLEEYLSKLFCNGCGKHCSLLSPRCGRGEQKVEEVKIEYNEQYSY